MQAVESAPIVTQIEDGRRRIDARDREGAEASPDVRGGVLALFEAIGVSPDRIVVGRS